MNVNTAHTVGPGSGAYHKLFQIIFKVLVKILVDSILNIILRE